MAGPSGLPYFLPTLRMDALKGQARRFFAIAYAPEKSKTRYRRGEPFHLGWLFDAAVVVTLLVAVMGYITA